MRRQLESDVNILKEKLAAVDRKIQNKPESRYLRDVRNTYRRAINSAEKTLQVVNDLDPTVLNNVAKFGKDHKV